ncbi:MAG: hypothetical protein K1X72_24125 [Pyrinomonadaceae bacterium]|nr:hypothetical protein [Pyrinomonadaceae bacterium]
MKFIEIVKLIALTLFLVYVSIGQTPTPTPSPSPTPAIIGEVNVTTTFANSDPLYQEIRKSFEAKKFSEQCSVVNNVMLQKDKGTFLLKTGEIYFLEPIQGRYTGAVFIGDGELSLTPPIELEKNHLSLFTDAPELNETYTELVMYFTDKTFDAIKNSPNAKTTTACPNVDKAASALKEKGTILKKRFNFNMSSRILGDFLTPKRRGFFTAFIEGKKFGDIVYQIDPLGITEAGEFDAAVYPEQVAVYGYGATNKGIWTSFHLDSEYKKGTANSWTDRRIYDIINHNIELVVAGDKIVAQDTLTVQTREPDIRFFPFDLYETLKVTGVRDENGKELSFIQEKKTDDPDFGVILEKAPEVGKPFKIRVEYEGQKVLLNVGSGNYALNPSARSNWYPNNPFTAFGDRAIFDVTYRYPKKLTMVSGGSKIGEDTIDGDVKVSKWSTEGIDYEVMGFNYGDFKTDKFTDPASGYELEVFANTEMPDFYKDFQKRVEIAESAGGTTGLNIATTNTTSGMSKVLTEAQNSVRLYNAYFGKLPYKRIAMTQQPFGNFGQSWTTLVYMPFIAYVDKATRAQLLGVRGGTNDFWDQVGPHEVAHQWWGHIVGWTSYRDQWMSEGFSEFSASLYTQFVDKDIDQFIDYWNKQRELIVTPRAATKGMKPYKVGPLVQGFKLVSSKTGNVYRYLIYPKGAFVLHMLRMMMYDYKEGTGDARFKAMMKDFIKTNFNKPVSTQDFQAAAERNITPEMDIDKNKTMNWFFDEWVYGTDVPSYKFEYHLQGNTLTGTITQSNVSKNFVMIVPIYADFGTGWQYLASVTLAGNDTLDIGKINLPKAPKKVAIAALQDILTEKIENVSK